MNLTKQENKRRLGIAAGFSTLCSALTGLFIQAQQQNIIPSVVFGGLSWLAYTATHYADTGRVLDTQEDIESHLGEKDEARGHKLSSLIGVVLFVVGAAMLAAGVASNSYPVTFLGVSGSIVGYAIFHYFMQGDFF